MVQLKALLPVLLEGEPDHAVDLPGLLEDLNLHGMYTDADLLFGAAPTNISSDTWHFLKTKIANFLSAEGSAADEIYQQETAHKADETNTRTHIDACNTGVESVDKLLGGGWTGEVVEILGDRGTGKTWLALHTVLRHLHSHPNEHALWLDTTSSFSAEFGHEILQSITAQRTVPPDSSVSSSENLNGSMLPDQPHKSHEASAAKDDAPSALDRLIVAKVFDLQSAIQAIQQVRAQRFEKIEDEPEREESNLPTNGRNEDEVKAADSEATIYSDVVPETGMLAMDMLLQSSDDPTTETNNLGEPSDHKRQTDTVPDQPTSEAKPSHLRFIIIDSIAALLKGVLTATSAEGHARMISFMRLLRSFTSVTLNGQHLFTTIFAINGLVSLASTANSSAALQSVFPMLNTERVKAALGPTFTYLTDWTIYLSHAKDVFHGANGLPAEMEADGRRSLICEVVRSRRMPQGRWAILSVNS